MDLLQPAALGDTVIHILSDRTKLLFQPRSMQAWFVLPQDDDRSAEGAQSHVVRSHLESHTSGGVRLRTEGPQGHFEGVVRKGADGWVCSTVESDVVGPATAPLSDEALTLWLQSFHRGSVQANA